jgi:hypothetical protein
VHGLVLNAQLSKPFDSWPKYASTHVEASGWIQASTTDATRDQSRTNDNQDIAAAALDLAPAVFAERRRTRVITPTRPPIVAPHKQAAGAGQQQTSNGQCNGFAGNQPEQTHSPDASKGRARGGAFADGRDDFSI